MRLFSARIGIMTQEGLAQVCTRFCTTMIINLLNHLLLLAINLLLLFLVVPDTQKNAKQPNTFLDKLSNQLPAIYMESIIFVN